MLTGLEKGRVLTSDSEDEDEEPQKQPRPRPEETNVSLPQTQEIPERDTGLERAPSTDSGAV